MASDLHSSSLVIVDEAAVTRGADALLRPCSASVDPGGALVITGGNGSGKTTLLTLLCGLSTPTAGTVLIDGRAPDERSPAFRSAVAGMLGLPPLARDLTVEEQLRLVTVSWGAPAAGPSGPHAVAHRLLDRLQIAHLADRFPHELSSGQLQLTGLALTLARPSHLLVLDEPEQRLDTERRGVVAGLLRELRDEGRALVVATHSPQIVDALATEVLDLDAAHP
ncbi:MAG: ABC transporter ATP-binding protein [Brevibacterium yomogidense]|uniref:ABC transporter ATP-binding protein n=1 Tax=Brevibacterium yomogidense TaxID=946573 RepID=A0A1X6XAA7_9MICO|nr:ATP-binding cassette domain-containing protein [Brevibacterium yomogidense]SLM96085.1 ABC transporter ATP-binding protein [Brevibacterium yomogidense]